MQQHHGIAAHLVLVGCFLLAACSTGSTEEAEPTATDTTAFCEEANAFITDRTVTDVSAFSANFFAGIDQRLEALQAIAPDDVSADVETLRAGFATTDTIFAEFDYDTTDEQLGPALLEVDNEEMLAATENIQTYINENCDIAPATAVDPAEVDAIMESFDVERTLAECLNAEFGDLASITSEELTPELLSRPACGTTLIAILSGG